MTLRNLKNWLRSGVESLEKAPVPFVYFILTFVSAVMLMNFLEICSGHGELSAANVLHHDVSCAALALLLMLLLHGATRIPVPLVARVVLPSFLILTIAPVLDLLLGGGRVSDISRLPPEVHGSYVGWFFTFFAPFGKWGISPGTGIEVGLVLLLVFGYIRLKGGRFPRCLIFTSMTGALILPFLAAAHRAWSRAGPAGWKFEYSSPLFIHLCLLISVMAGCGLAYSADRGLFRAMALDIRPFRLLHFLLMPVAGLVLASRRHPVDLSFSGSISLALILVGVLFAWVFSVVSNNLADLDIDRISSPGRPLVSAGISPQAYRKWMWPPLLVALFCAAMAHFPAFFFIALFCGNYFLYSMPPLRLKRIPFFSKLFISLNSLILIFLGYATVCGSFAGFPKPLVPYFLVLFTAAINFIDIKDYEGDRENGIRTLPVLLGLRRAKIVIGLFVVVTYLALVLIFRKPYILVPLGILGALQYALVNRKPYSENLVFAVYLLSLISALLYIVFFNVTI